MSEDENPNEWMNLTMAQIQERLNEKFGLMSDHVMAIHSLYDQYVAHLRDFTDTWETMRWPFLLVYKRLPEGMRDMVDSAEEVRMTYIQIKKGSEY
ncbi:MAG TPA: hypothetical protein VH593_06740 [Ktedonobacteraceae bacterium]|jgi:hypothetical protein